MANYEEILSEEEKEYLEKANLVDLQKKGKS